MPAAGRRSLLLLGLLTHGCDAKMRAADVHALMQLYEATGGADWAQNANWDATKDPCAIRTRWVGVGCVDPCSTIHDGPSCDFGRATALTLDNNHLVGSLTNWTLAGVLTNLTSMDLSFNAGLSGELPSSLGELNQLLSLAAMECGLEGTLPTELGEINARTGEPLEELFFQHNKISGSIPSTLASLTALISLELHDNRLSGSLPTQLGAALGDLKNLRLGQNRLGGTLPTQLGGLAQLSYLDLTNNEISGTLPNATGDLRWLQRLQLADNRLSGAIPDHVDNLWHLRRLELSDNRLVGNLPQTIGKLSNLEVLDVWNNSMSGDVPRSIRDLIKLRELYLAHEHLRPLRQRYCGQRLPDLGKYSYLIVQQEYDQMMASHCPVDQIHDAAFTWSSLQDSGVYEM